MKKSDLEAIVAAAMEKCKRENGERGWDKEDIRNAVYEMGGTEEDVMEAVKIGMNVMFGDLKNLKHIVN